MSRWWLALSLGLLMGLAVSAPARALEPLGTRGLAVINGGGGEFFLTPVPIDWTVARARRTRRIVHMAWVPEGQEAADWRDKVSVQMFPGSTDIQAETLLDRLAERYARDCGDLLATEVEVDEVRGYPTAFRFIGCPRRGDGGRGELALFRTVSGEQSFYLVQRAWRTPPFAADELPFAREVLGKTRLWLQGGRVCRAGESADRPACPSDLAGAMARTSLDKPVTVIRLGGSGSPEEKRAE